MDNIKLAGRGEFLYKPVFFKKVYTGGEMLDYTNERELELRLSGSLAVHNQFWERHPVVTSSIYGAVPCKILRFEQERKLLRFGWRKVDTEVYVFRIGMDERSVRQIGESRFKNFILTGRKGEEPPMLLRFIIGPGIGGF